MIVIGSYILGGIILLAAPDVSQSGGCPESDLGARLDALLGASEATGDGWRVDARVEDAEGTHVVVLEIEDPSGVVSTRTLSSPECAVAIDAAAFVVASAIDPALELSTAEPEEPEREEPEPVVPPHEAAEPEPEPELPPSVPRVEVSEPAPPPPPPPPSRPDVWLGLGPGMMAGALPGLVGRLVLLATVEGNAWRVRLDVAGTLPSDARSGLVSDVGANIGHWAVGGRGCGVFRRRRLSFSGCVGAEVGQLYAVGFGFEGASSTLLPWGAALGALGVEWRFHPRLRVWAEAEAGGVLNQAEIVVDNLERLHRLGPVFGRSTLGIAVRI